MLTKILDRWAEALGGRERLRAIQSITKRGQITAFDSNGLLEEQATPGCYRSVFKLEIGFATEVVVNGSQVWRKRDGNVAPMVGFEQALTLRQVWMSTFALLLPERGAPMPEFAGESEDGSAWLLTVPLIESAPYYIYIDKQTGLPQRAGVSLGMEAMYRSFQDWRVVEGVLLPFREIDLMEPGENTVTCEFTSITLNQPLPPDTFAPPVEDAPPFTFANGENSLGIPFEVAGNKVYFQVGVNGQPAWFILDTGAGATTLDTEFARRLGLKMTAMGSSGGAGAEVVELFTAQDVQLELPGIQFRQLTTDTLPLSTGISSVEGRPMQGLFGGDLICRMVIEIDYAQRLLNFYAPAHYPGRSHASILPITVQFNQPYAQAVVTLPGCAPAEGNFLVDTGVRSGLNLSTPFVNRHKLMQSTQNLVYATGGWGIGGQVMEYMGRGAVQLGASTFPNAVVCLSQATAGAEAAEFMSGIIGADILRRFFLVLDYSQQRLLLEPNALYAEPHEFDMSGVFLRSNAPDFDRLFILSVTAGSAAADAGLQAGDEITLLNGQPFTAYTVEQVRQMFRQPAQTCTLRVRRAEDILDVTLVTRYLV